MSGGSVQEAPWMCACGEGSQGRVRCLSWRASARVRAPGVRQVQEEAARHAVPEGGVRLQMGVTFGTVAALFRPGGGTYPVRFVIVLTRLVKLCLTNPRAYIVEAVETRARKRMISTNSSRV